MDHHLTVRLAPIDGVDVTVEMGGTHHDIPIVEFAHGDVGIHLGNHDDPVGWLRTVAGRLLGLAEQVEARTP